MSEPDRFREAARMALEANLHDTVRDIESVVAATIRTEAEALAAERVAARDEEWSEALRSLHVAGPLTEPQLAAAALGFSLTAAEQRGREAERREVEAMLRNRMSVFPERSGIWLELRDIANLVASRSAPSTETPHVLRLSPRDTEEFDRIMAEPFVPNEALREAAQRFQEEIDSGRLVVDDYPKSEPQDAASDSGVSTRAGVPVAGTPPAGASERGGTLAERLEEYARTRPPMTDAEVRRVLGSPAQRVTIEPFPVTPPGSASPREVEPGSDGERYRLCRQSGYWVVTGEFGEASAEIYEEGLARLIAAALNAQAQAEEN